MTKIIVQISYDEDRKASDETKKPKINSNVVKFQIPIQII